MAICVSCTIFYFALLSIIGIQINLISYIKVSKASFALGSYLVQRLFSPGATSVDCNVFQLSFHTGRPLTAASFGRVVSAPPLLEEKGARGKKASEQLKSHYIHEALPHWAPFCCRVDQLTSKCLNSSVCISQMLKAILTITDIKTKVICAYLLNKKHIEKKYKKKKISVKLDKF